MPTWTIYRLSGRPADKAAPVTTVAAASAAIALRQWADAELGEHAWIETSPAGRAGGGIVRPRDAMRGPWYGASRA